MSYNNIESYKKPGLYSFFRKCRFGKNTERVKVTPPFLFVVNTKERTEQSEITNKTSVSYSEAGSFNISDSKGKKETYHLKKFHKSLRRKIVQCNV